MKKTLTLVLASSILMAWSATVMSCGGKEKNAGQFPDNFSKVGDAGRVAYMMRHVAPDSLARFIIYASIGKVPGARIDTLAIATNYAYEHLRGQDMDKFGMEYDNVISSLSLPEKMKVLALGGSEDPQGLGYRLGLEYLESVRDDHKSVTEIQGEIAEFRKACASDPDTYERFVTGFKTALQYDGGKSIPADVYRTFVNMQ